MDNLLSAEIRLLEQTKQWKNEELSQHRHPASPDVKTKHP